MENMCGIKMFSAQDICKGLHVTKETAGYYTGIMGIYDRGNLNTGVMIRFLEQDAHGMCYKAGGGVTSQSVCRKEYEEVIRKVYLPLER